MALIAIAISFVVMISAVAISSGFRHELRKGIAEISGDIQLTTADLNLINADDPIHIRPSFLDSLQQFSSIREVQPVIYRPGIVKSGENIQGILIKATDNDMDSLCISVPARLAKMLELEEGDKLLTYFVGEKTKARNFRVGEIYDGILADEENLVVFARKEDLRRVNGWMQNECSAIELMAPSERGDQKKLQNTTDAIADMLVNSEGETSDLIAHSSRQRFPQLFAWMDLIDNNVLLVLVLMTIVAGFNMISGLLIMLFRNVSTIGILKAMGMTDKAISMVFLKAASDMVLKGMLIGNVIALSCCYLQGRFHLISLDPANYFLSYVPVSLDLPVILLAELLSYLVIMLLLLIPCLFVSRVDPARSVRMQ